MQQDKNRKSGSQEPEEGEGHLLLNIGKTVLLITVLAAAWFILEWLMGSK